MKKDKTLEQSHGNVENTNKQNSFDKERELQERKTDGEWQYENIKGEELIKFREVEGTPFTIIHETEPNVWWVAMGKHRLTEKFHTLEEAEEDAKRVDWNRNMQVMGVMIENYNKK